MNTKRLSQNQKEILEMLSEHPKSTQMEIARLIFNREISAKSSEFSSIGRSLRSLERRKLVERIGGKITWSKTQPQ